MASQTNGQRMIKGELDCLLMRDALAKGQLGEVLPPYLLRVTRDQQLQ